MLPFSALILPINKLKKQTFLTKFSSDINTSPQIFKYLKGLASILSPLTPDVMIIIIYFLLN